MSENPNYVVEVFKSSHQRYFIALMVLLAFLFGYVFSLPLAVLLPVFLGGEVGFFAASQNKRVQRIIREKHARRLREMSLEEEKKIVEGLSRESKQEFEDICQKVEGIEQSTQRARYGESDAMSMITLITDKMLSFRRKMLMMLQARDALTGRNYERAEKSLREKLEIIDEADREEATKGNRASQTLLDTIRQRREIVEQHLLRTVALKQQMRELDARLSSARDFLELLQDQTATASADLDGVSGLMDNMLTSLSIFNEFQSPGLDITSIEEHLLADKPEEKPSRPNLRAVKNRK